MDGAPLSDRGTLRLLVASAALLCVLLPIFSHFHDRSWIPSDDGHYAHIAERLLDGKILHTEAQEFHAAPVHLVHVWALKTWGRNLVSLRYPIAFMAIAQGILILLCFHSTRRSLYLGTAAALSIALVGPLQIANPTPNLYALFTVVCICAALILLSPSRKQWVLVGALIGLTFFFRQITGIFTAMAVLTCLLNAQADAPIESREPDSPVSQAPWISRSLLLVMLLGLLGYVGTATDIVGWLLFGIWPIGILLLSSFNTRSDPSHSATNRRALEIISMLGAGFLASVTALVVYYLYTGALLDFLSDFFIGAVQLTKLEHLHVSSYLYFLLGNLSELHVDQPLGLINRFYWWAIILVAAVNGRVLWKMISRKQVVQVQESILPLMAAFHSLVAVFNQIGFYLYVTAGLSLVSLIWLFAKRPSRWGVAALALAICAIGIYSHAGQPYTRTFGQSLNGERMPLTQSTLEKSGAWSDAAEQTIYAQVVSVLQENTQPGEFIFALPNNPEIYFLADRLNPFRLMNTTISLNGPEEIREFLLDFDGVSPHWVVHDTKHHYNTSDTEFIMNHIRSRYDQFVEIDRFVLFKLRNDSPPDDRHP